MLVGAKLERRWHNQFDQGIVPEIIGEAGALVGCSYQHGIAKLWRRHILQISPYQQATQRVSDEVNFTLRITAALIDLCGNVLNDLFRRRIDGRVADSLYFIPGIFDSASQSPHRRITAPQSVD